MKEEPDDEFVLDKRAFSNYKIEDYQSAKDDYNRLIEIGENNADNYYYLSKVLFELEEYLESLKSIDKAINISEEKYPSYHFVKARINYRLSNFEEALSQVNLTIDLGNKSSYIY